MIPYFDAPSLDVGGVVLHAFGLLALAGLVFGAGTALAYALLAGRSPLPSVAVALALPVVGFPAAHIAYLVAYEPDQLASLAVLQVWRGMSFTGLALAMLPVALLSLLLDRESAGAQLDGLALGLVVFTGFYRLGCFLAHDHPGLPSHFPLAVQGICRDDWQGPTACHDLGLYYWLGVLGIGALAAALHAWKHRPRGLIGALVPLVYAPYAFGVEALAGGLWTWSYAALLALGLALLAAVLVLHRSGSAT